MMQEIRKPSQYPEALILSDSEAESLFPFITRCAFDGRILSLSHAMVRTCPEISKGQNFLDHFVVLRPHDKSNFFATMTQSKGILLHKVGSTLSLKGQVLKRSDQFILLLAPHVAELADLKDSGLLFDDFPVHDPIFDFLMILQHHKSNYAALQKIQFDIQALVTSLYDLVFEVDKDAQILNFWGRDSRVAALPKESFIGKNLGSILGSDFQNRFLLNQQTLGGLHPSDFDFRILTRPEQWYNCKIEQIWGSKEMRFSVLIREISALKRSEIKLKETERRLSIALNSIEMGVWELDCENLTLVWDQRMFKIYGFIDPIEPKGEDWINLVHPEDRARVEALFRKILSYGSEFECEYRIFRGNYEIRWLKLRGHIERNSDGKATRLTGCNWDCTKQKKAMELSNNLGALIEKSSDIYCYFDIQGTIYYQNSAASKTFGWSSALETIVDVFDSQHRKTFQDILRSLRTGTSWQGELAVVHQRTRESIPVYAHLFEVYSETDNTRFLAMKLRDLRKQKADESLLLQSSKMVSLGEMAGGIAHELNNPLAILSGRAFMLKRRTQAAGIDTSAYQKDIDSIQETVQRMAKIIKGLLAFARKSDQDPMQLVTVEQVFEETLAFCETRARHQGVKVTLSIPPELVNIKIFCRPGQIEQILVNLIQNSLDAIQSDAEPWIKLSVEQNESLVLMRVTDSGKGIPNGILDKIMEPFFTTKERGRGTGLGLSIAKGLAAAHEGWLAVDQRAANTTIVLALPSRHQET